MKKLRLLALGAATLACAGTIALTTSCGGSGTKFGFIFLHDDNSTYDKNFIEAAKTACENKGVKAVLQVNVNEDENCYTAAKDLVNKGCKGVFADSFGHEPFMIQAAKEFKDVQFAHATGTMAHTEKLDNFHNAFANIYEGRYIAGVAAGLKLNDMIDKGTITATQAVMGYVGAFPYAEVVSGYTSFYLGAKSVCPEVTMKVRYTNSWYDPTKENTAATTLIDDDNCVLISQHADSQGAPSVCESKHVPNVFYNGENKSLTNSYLTSSRINWVPFFEYFIDNTLNGTKMDYDWCGNLANGAVEYYSVNENIAAAGTKAKMDEAATKIKNGTLNIFDTNTFTVSRFGNGVDDFTNLNAKTNSDNRVTSYMADVDTDPDYTGDKQVIEGGVFKESVYRSAPYFDIRIDGITEL
ncbi:MAG: BMP family ABC transporter substrate-binding protein [Acholeplasmatales bacterium]|nr:BMP family ABC transporter substrate-binding protein [Acholeplasmatales bacterium]